MLTAAPTESIASLIASARVLCERLVTLATLEGPHAGLGLRGAMALGYFALGRSKPKRGADPASPGAWSQVVRTVQVLLPLLIALDSAAPPRPRANPRANIGEAAWTSSNSGT